MLFSWFQRRRRRRIVARPLPADTERTLQRQVRHFSHLPAAQRDRAVNIVQVLLAEKDWSAAGKFELSEEMRIAIAGRAAVMASGFSPAYYFDRLHAIVVHRRTIHFTGEQTARNPLLPGGFLAGIAWHRGPIVLSWSDVGRELRGRSPGRNVVMHELAHYFDGLRGDMDGTPPLDRDQRARWEVVAEDEFLRLVGNARRRESSLLDKYGATNRAEFFAVATECFFERPHRMREAHRGLYEALSDFYQQSPADWMPRLQRADEIAAAPKRSAGRRHRPPVEPDAAGRKRRRMQQNDLARLQALRSMSAGDAMFTLGLAHLQEGRNDDAERVLTELIDADPADEEALSHRAMARLRLGQFPSALEDCNAALAIDPEDVDALWVRGEIALKRGDVDAALADLNLAASLAENDPEVRLARGNAMLQLGRARKAIDEFSKAIAIDPYLAIAYFQRARAHRELGKPSQAERDSAKALLLDPSVANGAR